MTAYYPTSIRTFDPKNPTEPIYAEHINDIQDEITKIEEELGRSASGGYSSVKARIVAIEDGYMPLTGTLAMTGDLDMGGYAVNNVADSASLTSAATVGYVGTTADSLEKMSLVHSLMLGI